MQTNCLQCTFGNESWSILSDIERSIKQKVETVGVPLRDWDLQIYRGILTGYNDAFIISSEKRDEILANCADEEERERTAALIRPNKRSYGGYMPILPDRHAAQSYPSNNQDVA